MFEHSFGQFAGLVARFFHSLRQSGRSATEHANFSRLQHNFVNGAGASKGTPATQNALMKLVGQK